MRNRLLTVAGALVLLAVFGKFFARPLLAQVRAALVLNVDDPGRVAYQSVLEGNTGTNCFGNGGGCRFQFPVVPSGHRLVIQHVSAEIVANANGVPASVGVGPVTDGINALVFYATVQSGSFIQFDQPVLVYVDAGQIPQVLIIPINGVDAGSPNIGQIATLFGYMLDCSAGPCAAIAH
jgi:hypothetical protein